MINKIQKYLLLKQPIIWNIRIVPMLLILAGMHLLFFSIGYLATNTDFGKSYYSFSPLNTLGSLYFVCILIGILLLIGWLVFYSRNNGFKTFYPRKAYQLYLEWLMILIITIGISFIPYSLIQGYIVKWKSVASQEEAMKAIEILDKASLLIPQEESYYMYYEAYDKPIPIPLGIKLKADSIDLSQYRTKYSYKSDIQILGYIGPSLLFFKNNEYTYRNYFQDKSMLHSEDILRINRQELVKKWLRSDNKDSVYAVMKGFEKLQLEHNYKINLSPQKWMKRIYNPPFFAVNERNFIANREPYYGDSNDYDETQNNQDVVEAVDSAVSEFEPAIAAQIPGDISAYNTPYLQYDELSTGYNHVLRFYDYNEEQTIIALLCCCFALGAATFIYSFRCTGGKPWLIALISTGVLIFISILSGVAIIESIDGHDGEIMAIFITLFWLIIFTSLLIRIISKISYKSNKGKSIIYMNLLIWLIPCLVPMVFFMLGAYSELSDKDFLKLKDDNVTEMFWINLPVSILCMWLVSVLVRKWKSLPEE